MASITVDLPAHNAYIESTEDLVSVIGGDGLETVATNDTATYIRFNKEPSSAESNGWAFRVGRGGSLMGFGLWDLPPGATITDMRFVMTARLPLGAGGDIPDDGFTIHPDRQTWGDGAYDASSIETPVYRWPMVDLHYSGDGFGFGGYSFSQIPTDGSWAEMVSSHQVRHLIFGSDYVISGIGTPDTGINGLCPRIYVDPSYPAPNISANNRYVDVAYLAIRITYTPASSVAPPCHLYPRDDDQGAGSGAIWPPPSSGRPGSYY